MDAGLFALNFTLGSLKQCHMLPMGLPGLIFYDIKHPIPSSGIFAWPDYNAWDFPIKVFVHQHQLSCFKLHNQLLGIPALNRTRKR
tara:strand:+ start:21020 stop:21277 length:258 start_codon:yes stop_codon:yes gene_type:complete